MAKKGTYQILDARSAAMFANGHIETAKNVPFTLFYDGFGLMKSVANRKAALATHNVDLTKKITVYCQTGITAALLYAALYDLMEDHAKLYLYDGGWTEYSPKTDW